MLNFLFIELKNFIILKTRMILNWILILYLSSALSEVRNFYVELLVLLPLEEVQE